MGEDLLTTLSMENHHPSTLLSMDPSGGLLLSSSHEDSDRELLIQRPQVVLSGAPDINLPLSAERSPSQQSWNSDPCDMLDVGLGPQLYDAEATLHIPKVTAARKCTKRGDSIWGAWFFFSFYFKPILSEKSKGKVIWDENGVNGFDKSDVRHDVFLVQHDMENMYMWVFKERPENALGKMQLRSYMNGHSRLGEPQFPFSVVLSGAPDINLPLSAERSPSQQSWNSDPCDMLDVGLGPQLYDAEATLHIPKVTAARKCTKRGDSIWGRGSSLASISSPFSREIQGRSSGMKMGLTALTSLMFATTCFLVQHDMENMYMWVFKERPENALGKMQLRSYMNGHSRLGEPQFPFSVDRGFVRSHRMQRKQYRGLSNPQCVHGIEVVRSPNLMVVCELDRKKWVELTGRDLNFSIPLEASDFELWRNLTNTEFELERPPPLKNISHPHPKKSLNVSSLNLSSQSNHSNGEGMDLCPVCSKRRKDFFPHVMHEDFCLPANPHAERGQDVEMHEVEPSWLNEFTGVMKHAYGPVTAAKTIYEDDEGYLIMVSLPFADQQRVKVSWRNNLTHGILKIICVSTARMPYIKRHDRTFKLTDPSPEHCPPGEFIREITLPTRIPEDANLEAYYDETGALLEIMVPKHRVGPEEHEVRVCMRPPHLGANDLLLT
ncbi:hypothetical protein C4D60_Mb07t18780 [Musa balbisiana]|uniref:SHSP domain-containing protein n=1 Tax=Musa balbisiana TaxID=52838 RepID=A0A4S8JGK1_MUSBA|nr:hypothetical protein C4D60_Mb07t18780 [Musa balbisiana]